VVVQDRFSVCRQLDLVDLECSHAELLADPFVERASCRVRAGTGLYIICIYDRVRHGESLGATRARIRTSSTETNADEAA
jgi:hypothetical protein